MSCVGKLFSNTCCCFVPYFPIDLGVSIMHRNTPINHLLVISLWYNSKIPLQQYWANESNWSRGLYQLNRAGCLQFLETLHSAYFLLKVTTSRLCSLRKVHHDPEICNYTVVNWPGQERAAQCKDYFKLVEYHSCSEDDGRKERKKVSFP